MDTRQNAPGSQGGSSKGAGSMSGSAAASQSQATTARGVAAVLQRGILFPIIAQAELRVDWKLSVFGLLVEALQLIALVFNPNFVWGPMFGDYIGKVVYFFNMPLYDGGWASNGFIAANIFFWMVIICQVVLFGSVVGGLNSEHQQFTWIARMFGSVAVHAFSSFLFLPSILILTSFMVCDTSRVHLYWYTEQACSSTFASVYFACGVIGLVIISFLNFFVSGTLFDDQPSTQSLMARSDNTVTTWYLIIKIVAGISFHVLLSKGLHHVFATALTAVFLAHSIHYAFMLPFFRLSLNRYRCAVLLVAATFAGVASSEAPFSSQWHQQSSSTVVVLCVGVGMFVVGWLLPTIRLNSNYRQAAQDLHRGRLMRAADPVFPLGLPSNDLAFSANKNIESVFISHHGTRHQGGDEDDEESITLLEPYISHVIVNTDIELSTRFLNEHFDNCGSQPTDKMKAHGARIFSKGIARFRRDPLLIFHYCQFLTVFGKKNRVAIAEIDNMNKYEPSFTLSYRAFRSQVKLKASLNMSDTTHLKLLNSTLRLHKEILGHMSTFWLKLLSPNVDTVQLAAIANTITTRRESAAEMFHRVLLTPNQNILLKYARFLEQVMLDSNTARIITDRVAEQAEAKRQELLAANQHGNGGREQKAESEIAVEHADLMTKIEEASKEDAALAGNSGQSSTIDRLSYMVHVFFFALILTGVGYLIYEGIRETGAKNGVLKIQAAGRCRYLVTMGGYYAGEIQRELTKTVPNSTLIVNWKNSLAPIATEFYQHHSELTQGSLVTSFGPLVSFLKGRRTEVFQPDTTGLSLSGSYNRQMVDLFNLGFSIASAMTTIATANTSLTNSLSFMVLNARENFGFAYNRSIYYYELEAMSEMNNDFWAVTGIFAGAAVLIFVIYSTMILNFQKIGASKLLTLNLFTLIPRIYLEQLHIGSKEKLETFDADDQQDQQDIDGVHELTLGGGSTKKPTNSMTGRSLMEAQQQKSGSQQQQQRKVSVSADEVRRDGKEEEDTKDESNEFSEAEEEDTKKADSADKGMSSTVRTLLYALLLVVVLCVVFAFSVAAFVVVYEIQDMSQANHFRRNGAILNQGRLYQYYSALTQLSDEARLYVQSGSIDSLVRYFETWASSRMERLHQDIVFDSSFSASSGNLDVFLQMQTLTDDLLRRQNIALWLASASYNVPAEQSYLLQRIFASGRAYNFTLLQTTITNLFSTFAVATPPRAATDQVRDGALSAATKLLTAKSLLFDDVYQSHFPLLEQLRSTLIQSDLADIADTESSVRQYFIAALALYAGCFIFFILLIKLYGSQVGGSSVIQRLGLLIGIIVVTANIIVLSVFFVQADLASVAFRSKTDFMDAKNTSLSNLRYQSSIALTYAEFGEKRMYHAYVDAENNNIWEESLNELLRVLLKAVNVEDADTPNLIKTVINVRGYGEQLFSMDETALYLATSGYGYDLTSDEFSFLSTFAYNRAREANYSADVARFGFSNLIYTNKTYDIAGLPSDQLLLAQSTVSSQRFIFHKESVLRQISDAYAQAESRIDSNLDNQSAIAEQAGLATLALSVVILLLMVMTGMYAAFSTINDLSSDVKSTAAGQVSQMEREQLFEDLTDRSRAALAVVTILLCGIYGYDIYVTRATAQLAHNLNLASTREWNIARSMVEVQQLIYDPQSPSVASPYASHLKDIREQLLKDRNDFYLGNNSNYPDSFNAISQDSLLLFGSNTYTSQQYLSDCHAFRGRSYITAQDMNVSSPASWMYDALFSDGVEPVVLQWIYLLDQVAAAPTIGAAQAFRSTLMNIVGPLTDKLAAASTTYHSTRSDFIVTLGMAHYALVAAFIFLIVVLLLLVFRPMISLLLNEEQGTKLLLRMIPPNVRQNVPAISEYLETGSITQNEKMQKINEVVTEMSVVSLFVIDWTGTILRVSPAAREEFGYENDELVGKNVKILMTDDVAKNHDDYIRRYRTTSEARVVDRKTRQMGKRKDGGVFPVELMVREFRKNANESTFLGFVRNITSELEYERVTKLNEAVSDMSHIPVIVIDAVGIIRRINRAGVMTFGYSPQEILGKNVKQLMPTRISINHDQYLEAYQKTRKKTIIDSSRKVMGLRKNGEEFPVEVTVKEMVNDKGRTQFFIGYAKDITTDLLFTQSVMANEAVIQISPTPVISINPVGNILIFSPAAENSWGYKAEEVLGKNIRMLMTEEDSIRHDGYLARYMKTGEKHIVDSVRSVKAKRKDGRVFLVEANIKELRKGDHVSFIGYLRDLTSENETAHKNRVNKTVITASPVPIVVIDEIGTVLQFNPSAEKQLGYRADQVINQNVKMLMPDVVAENHDGYLQRYRDTGVKVIIDSKRRAHAKKADGRQMAVEIAVKEVVVEDLLSESGKKRLFVGYIRDITEEFQMMKANILNDAITNLCTIPMISINRFGSILTFSLASEKQFGYKFEEVVGKNIKMLMPKSIADNHDGYLKRYLETGEKHIIDTTRIATAVTSSGKEFPVEIAVKEIRKSGLDTIYVGYVRDVKTEIEVEDTRLMVDTIVNVSPAPVVVINSKGLVQKFSSEAQHVFGWRPEEIIGKNVKMLMPQEIARAHDNYLKNYLKNGVKTIIDGVRTVQAVRKDGLQLSVEVMVRELKKDNEKGSENSLFVGYLRDMSQEYILRQSNELKDVILNESSIPMIQIDTLGKIMFVNPALLSEFQYEEDELLGANIKTLCPPEIARVHDSYLANYVRTGIKHVIDSVREVSAVRKDGSRFPINISIRELLSDGNKTYFGYIRNMTQSMLVRDQKALGDIIIDLSMIPLVIIDDLGTVMAFNRAASETFRYAQEEVVGKNVKMLQTAEVAAVHDQYLASYKVNRVKNVIDTTRRVMGRKKNGYAFPLEITVKEMYDPVVQKSTYVGYLRNITDEYRLNLANEIADAVSVMSPIPLIAITTKGIITKFSRAAEEEFGYAAEEIIGQNIKLLQPPEIAEAHDGYLERYIKTGVKRVIDTTRNVPAKKRNGDIFPAEITVKEIHIEGADRTFVGFLRNLSQDLADEAGSKINGKVMEMMMTPAVVINEQGTVEEANASLLETFGYESEELLGSNVNLLMPEEIAEHHDSYLAKYLETGVKQVLLDKRTVTAKHKDGTKFPVEIHVKELFSKELNRRSYFGFLRDLRQELELKYAFQLNDAITDMITTPIIAIDQSGVILKFSKAASNVFDYDSSDVVGKNISMLMPEPFSSSHDGYLTNYLNTQKKTVVDSERRVTARKKDGTTFSALLRVSEFAKSGGFTTFVGFLKDMTEIDAQEQELRVSSVVSSISNLAIIIADKRGFIQSVNLAAAELFRYRAEDLVGQNVKLLMPRHYAMHHDNYLENYHRTGVKHIIDTSRRAQGMKKGDITFEIEIGVRELDLDGIGTRYLGFVRDVTNEVALEEATKVSGAIVAFSPVPIVVMDFQGTVMQYSDLADTFFGYTKDEVVGRNIKMLMSPEVAEKHDQYLETYLKTRVKHVIDSTRKTTAKKKDGTLIEVEIAVKEIKSSDNLPYYVGFVKPSSDTFSAYESMLTSKAGQKR